MSFIPLKVLQGGSHTHSTANGSYTAVVTNASKDVVLSGVRFTVYAKHIRGAFYIDVATGNRYDIPLNNVGVVQVGTTVTLTFNSLGVNFATGDDPEVFIDNTNIYVDNINEVLEISDTNRDRNHRSEDVIANVTNAPIGTYYHPLDLATYDKGSLQVTLIGSLTVKIQVSNDPITAYASITDWRDITFELTGAATQTASFVVDDFVGRLADWKYVRIEVAAGAATDDYIIYGLKRR